MEDYSNLSTLIIDDSKIIIELLKQSLAHYGFKNIHTSMEASKSLSIIKQREVKLVLCDWNMPKMTGTDLIRSIRSDPKNLDIMFIMITSESAVKKVQEALAHGVDSYIVKPFSPESVMENIERVIRKRQQTFPPFLRNKSALIVEDSATVQELLCSILQEVGIKKTLKASCANQAKEILKSGESVDFILCDWYMPESSGLEMLQWVRSKGAVKNLPFIMVTSESKSDNIQEALSQGVNEYLIKPFNMNEVLGKIQRVLR